MNYQNLKRVQFLERLIAIIATYFFGRACLHFVWLSTSGVEYIANYLILVIVYVLISQITRAEQNQKLNKLSLLEITMFLGVFVLAGLEFLK